jgi:hypothetical protein
LYLTAYELLRGTVIDRIQSFFTHGFADEDSEAIIDEQYKEIERLHNSVFLASCLWLQQNSVISSEDAADIVNIRRHRNQIAHELPEFLGDADREINLEYLQNIRRLLRKIETWWIRNVDLHINSDFDDIEVTDEDIHPGSVLVLNEIIRIALSSDGNQ